ncbi:alpha/beta hydrolase [Erythrobacter crassostreae]|uniref:Alpha/beta hydrolase n=1 Tax=Erythrobacter crassostreae TaxID=2828328 RepID=A0A9X1F3A5_9SPHN|nr:alpha/beta hydrolase [Erythrobacter crassostrea]MBV7259379.1 alpha/beta hydrolase [Erythrobacter crassostrea]
MKRVHKNLIILATTAVIATPILAQQRERPSRECMQEVRELCGRDRSQIRSCLQEKADQLSSKCSGELRDRMQQRRGARDRGNRAASQTMIRPDRTIIYGNDQRQQIDVFEPEGAVDELPLVLHIHGGGWSVGNHKLVQSKPAHFTNANYFFASAGYRLMPDAPVEQQAADIGTAIQALRGQASAIGFDPDRIVVMGHSAGAHLAALVSTDPQYAGEAFDAIRGVILLDGAGYEISSSMANAGARSETLYKNVFGEDADRHRALSPVTHVGGADAPNWLAFYVAERAKSKEQSELLVGSLTEAGSAAQAVPISNTDHGRMNREIGIPAGAEQTQAIDAFLGRVFN